MRDIFLLLLLPLMLYTMAKRPFIALGMWIWTAMFFPNAWVYGIASNIRYNLLFTGVTVASYLVLKNKPKLHFGLLGGLVLLFFFWTTLSTMTTLGNPDIAWEIWNRFAKVNLLFVFVLLIIDRKLHVDFFLWCVVLSIGFYGNLEALKFLASGGFHKIAGFEGHALGDRNELALAFVMTLPVCFYLMGQYAKSSRVLALGLMGTMALLVTAIIGTQSRGGFIALMGLGGYMFLKSDRKVLLGVLIGAIVIGLSYFVSTEWVSRIDTINAVDEDASFMGRVVAWKLSFILAVNHPFLGGGFKSLEYFPVWSQLSQEFLAYPFFYSGDALPSTVAGRAAHSIYFQVLGEHGFVGLAIYLVLMAAVFLKAGALARKARKAKAPTWISTLATMLQLSIFSFCLGGAALSFAYFELIYAFIGLIVVLDSRILPAELRAAGAQAAAVTAPGRKGAAWPATVPAP